MGVFPRFDFRGNARQMAGWPVERDQRLGHAFQQPYTREGLVMSDTQVFADLAENLRAFLRHCIEEEGFACPLYVTAAASNGSTYVVTFLPGDDGLEAQIVASRVVGAGFKLPIAIVAVSSNAEAAYMRLVPTGEPTITMLN